MDLQLRILERRMAQGDPMALAALYRARRRSGLGWQGEALPPRMLVGPRPPLYLWDPGKGHRIEMVWEGQLWISRRTITAELFRTFARATRTRAPGGATFTRDEATAYARWAGVALPRIIDLFPDGEPEVLLEWLADGRLRRRDERRPFRVVVRSRGATPRPRPRA
jgi:hypothetical protein